MKKLLSLLVLSLVVAGSLSAKVNVDPLTEKLKALADGMAKFEALSTQIGGINEQVAAFPAQIADLKEKQAAGDKTVQEQVDALVIQAEGVVKARDEKFGALEASIKTVGETATSIASSLTAYIAEFTGEPAPAAEATPAAPAPAAEEKKEEKPAAGATTATETKPKTKRGAKTAAPKPAEKRGGTRRATPVAKTPTKKKAMNSPFERLARRHNRNLFG